MRTIILLILSCLPALAQLNLSSSPYSALLNQRKNSGTNYTYFFTENFEAPGYENPWVMTGTGTFNPSYTGAPGPLQALRSLLVDLSAQNGRIYCPITPTNRLYGFFMVDFTIRPPSGNPFFCYSVAAGTILDTYWIGLSGANHIQAWKGANLICTTPEPLPDFTTNYIWFSCVSNSGNMDLEIAFSTNAPVRPTSGGKFASGSAGTILTIDTVNIAQFPTGGGGLTYQGLYDKIRVSTSYIGNNPN